MPPPKKNQTKTKKVWKEEALSDRQGKAREPAVGFSALWNHPRRIPLKALRVSNSSLFRDGPWLIVT